MRLASVVYIRSVSIRSWDLGVIVPVHVTCVVSEMRLLPSRWMPLGPRRLGYLEHQGPELVRSEYE